MFKVSNKKFEFQFLLSHLDQKHQDRTRGTVSRKVAFLLKYSQQWKKYCELGLNFIFESVQKQPTEVFYKKGVLKNFAIFTGKHLFWSFFLIKLQGFTQVFFTVNIAKFLRALILKNIYERLLLLEAEQIEDALKTIFKTTLLKKRI